MGWHDILRQTTVLIHSILARFPAIARDVHAIQFSGADAFEQGGGGFVVFVLFYQLTAESLFQDGLAQRVGLLQRGGEGLVELVGFGEFGFEFGHYFDLFKPVTQRQSKPR